MHLSVYVCSLHGYYIIELQHIIIILNKNKRFNELFLVHDYLEFYMNPIGLPKEKNYFRHQTSKCPMKKEFSPNLIDLGINGFLKTTTKIYSLYCKIKVDKKKKRL